MTQTGLLWNTFGGRLMFSSYTCFLLFHIYRSDTSLFTHTPPHQNKVHGSELRGTTSKAPLEFDRESMVCNAASTHSFCKEVAGESNWVDLCSHTQARDYRKICLRYLFS
uniref:Secreted protein n=1 Tax=Steinernema glaseri TaxID=37863 RepID=A0A1I7ZAJ8_9BILA